jgi:hypothetical protein
MPGDRIFIMLRINMPNDFNYFYKENDSWLTYDPNPLQTLRRLYPEYFHADEQARVDYSIIKQALLDPRDTAQQKTARQMFLNLFSMPHVNSYSHISTPALNQIEKSFGVQIMAHGVEEAKGGMRTLLIMALSNQVKSPAVHFGAFVSGPPNISPLSHGPYYLIYSMPSAVKTTYPDYPAFTDIAKVLVPFDENKIMLTEKLNEMHRHDLISTEKRDIFINKLVTYDAFLAHLKALTPDISKKRRSADSAQASALTELSLFGGDERRTEDTGSTALNPVTL